MLGMVWNTIGMGKKSRHLRESLKKKKDKMKYSSQGYKAKGIRKICRSS